MNSTICTHCFLATALAWPGAGAQPQAQPKPRLAPGDTMVRIKDITDIEGVQANPLYGLGLVVGLAGSGSKGLFTQQLAVDMLQKLDVSSKIVTESKLDNVLQSDNIVAVMVTAKLPPFARRSSRIDVTVSTFDDANSLQGGTLLMTPLYGADRQVYAVAQGPISIGGFSFGGQAATAQKNHPTTGRIVGGATVEKEARAEISHDGRIGLLLRQADYATATDLARAINTKFRGAAMVVDAGTVELIVPPILSNQLAKFVSDIGVLRITPDLPARVIINERTGTVVAGERVRIATVAIAHGNLKITTSESPQVSQPAPFSRGQTTVVNRTQVDVVEQEARLQVIDQAVTVADLARALNSLGVTPRDLIAIFQALKQHGALHAELIIM